MAKRTKKVGVCVGIWHCRGCTKTVSGDVPITNTLRQECHQEAEGNAGIVILYYNSRWMICSIISTLN
ncbi:hypothetical protein LAZ67_14000137 [Cordylochernes scorpioides]|uniref:Uncharacterized protein n=1 Tax=Cordylochernes scorpioides TaxID=51811 RepID=A0ABY6L817_9ARAC|nr:hypothetical protein LAZ67_14000137 [Cordylochernes scorpioides]